MKPPKLHEDQQDALQVRSFIASTTEILTKTDIAEGFGISRMTMYRYGSPELQEKNRENAKKAIRHRSPTHCRICRDLIAEHPRCTRCTILIHSMDTKCIGKSEDMVYCNHCAYGRQTI